MHHAIPVHTLGAEGRTMARAVEACVHCGFCLPACPTYRVLGEEMDSPRGRIVLMKSALEGTVPVRDTLPFIDRCLGCLACVPACPSGVRYGELLPLFRAHAASHRRRPLWESLVHALVHSTLPSPARARVALRAARAARSLNSVLPAALRPLMAMAPSEVPPAVALPAHAPAMGRRRARVALLAGCIQQVVAPSINRATLRVLTRNGVEVLVPPDQGCCGGLAWHAGDLPRARAFAQRLLSVLPEEVDAVVTNAAGCGSAMKEYGVAFAGQPGESRARALEGRVRDVSEFLADLGLVGEPSLAEPTAAVYHEACHLTHAQGVSAAPRALLGRVGNLSLVPLDEADVCCGSAGTYNLEQPALADELGARKARHVARSGAGLVVTGNVGCIVQIRAHLERARQPLPVWHTMEVLDRAYGRRDQEPRALSRPRCRS